MEADKLENDALEEEEEGEGEYEDEEEESEEEIIEHQSEKETINTNESGPQIRQSKKSKGVAKND